MSLLSTEIVEPGSLTDEDYDRIISILAQLNATIPVSRDEIDRVVASETTMLLIVRNEAGLIVGTAQAACNFTLLAKNWAHIEDVVVDDEYRKQGFGGDLLSSLLMFLEQARFNKATLTSNSLREDAVAMYGHYGFEKKDTNYMVLEI